MSDIAPPGKALQDQVAVVTGASSGIGKAIALALAAQGARLCLVGRNRATLNSVAGAAGVGAQHLCYEADLASAGAVQNLIDDIKRAVPTVDILVHGAAIISPGTIETATPGQLDDHYQLNLRAPYALTQGLLAYLKRRPGQILFLNSSVGLTARAGVGQYAATKHALKAIADSLREEVNPAGVRVLSLFLGRTASPMQAAIHALEDKPYQPERLMQPEDVAAVALHCLALPRSVEVTDVSMRPLRKIT